MQRRTTPLEAFQEAARFTSTMLQQPIEENRERNLNRLKVDNEIFDLRITDWMSKNPFEGGRNDAEDQTALNSYRDKLRAFIDSEGRRLRGNSSSRYYDEQMGYAIKQHIVNAEGKAFQKAEQWRTDRAFIGVDNYREAELEAVKTGARTPMEAVTAIVRKLDDVRGDEYNPGVEISLELEHQFMKGFKRDVYTTVMTEAVKGITDPLKVKAALTEAQALFAFLDEETDEDELDEHGNSTGKKKIKKWTFDKKDEFDKELLSGSILGIFGEWESQGRHLLTNPTPANIREYNRRADQARAKLAPYFDPNKPEYQDVTREHRAQMDGWFRSYENHLRAASSGTGAARQTGINLTREGIRPFIEEGLQGYYERALPNGQKIRMPITMYDAQNRYFNTMYDAAVRSGYNGSIENFKRDYSAVNLFYDEVNEVLKNRGSEYAQFVNPLSLIKEQIQNMYKNETFKKLYPDQQEFLERELIDRYWDVFNSILLPGANVEDILRQTQNFLNTKIAEREGILNRPEGIVTSGRTGSDFDQTLAKYLFEFARPDRVWTDTRGQTRYSGVSERVQGEIRSNARDRLLQELRNQDRRNWDAHLEFVRYEESERGHDVNGIMIFKNIRDPSMEYRVTSRNGTDLIFEKKERGSGWTLIRDQENERRQAEAARERERIERARGISESRTTGVRTPNAMRGGR